MKFYVPLFSVSVKTVSLVSLVLRKFQQGPWEPWSQRHHTTDLPGVRARPSEAGGSLGKCGLDTNPGAECSSGGHQSIMYTAGGDTHFLGHT